MLPDHEVYRSAHRVVQQDGATGEPALVEQAQSNPRGQSGFAGTDRDRLQQQDHLVDQVELQCLCRQLGTADTQVALDGQLQSRHDLAAQNSGSSRVRAVEVVVRVRENTILSAARQIWPKSRSIG